MQEPAGPHFINVDFEIFSIEDLTPFAEAVERRSFILYNGPMDDGFMVSMETSCPDSPTPELALWRLIRLLRSLSPSVKRLMLRAQSRIFDIGFGCGSKVEKMYETPPRSGIWKSRAKALPVCATSLSPKLLRAVSDLRASITTTIYPPRIEVRRSHRKPR